MEGKRRAFIAHACSTTSQVRASLQFSRSAPALRNAHSSLVYHCHLLRQATDSKVLGPRMKSTHFAPFTPPKLLTLNFLACRGWIATK